MKAMGCPGRTRAQWMTFVMLGGMLWGLTAPAHAQAQPIGIVLGVPATDLDRFQQANASPGVDNGFQPLPPNNVQVLHVSKTLGEPFNTEIATVSVTSQATGQRPQFVFFPVDENGGLSPLYQQINASDNFLDPTIIGQGSEAVVQVGINQSDVPNLDLESARFLLVPADRVGSIEVTNPSVDFTVLHQQQAVVNGQILPVALLAVDVGETSTIQIPSGDLAQAILALNSNLAVQGLTGSSVFDITTILVS